VASLAEATIIADYGYASAPGTALIIALPPTAFVRALDVADIRLGPDVIVI
jgi:hypothetical protein